MSEEVGSIHFKADTTDLARAEAALTNLAGAGPKVEKSLDVIEKAASKTGKSLKTLGEGAGKGLNDIGKTAPKAAEGVGRVAKSADDAKKALAGIGSSASNLGQVSSAAAASARGMAGFSAALQSSQKTLFDLQAQVRAAAASVAQLGGAVATALPSMQAVVKAQSDAAKSALDMGVAFKSSADQMRAYSASSAGVADASAKTARSLDATATAARAFTTAMAVAGVGFGASELIGMVDGYGKVTAQLRLATNGASDYAAAMDSVRQISRSAQQGLGEVGTLYARIANGTAELGISQKRLSDITEVVALSLRASNATASESSSAMLQLSQAFASGVLRGEEFNSVNEAAPRLMKALADGIGQPVGALRKMAEEGKLTSEVLATALPKALEEVRVEAAKMQTIGGSFTVLKNSMMEFFGTTAQASGAVSGITKSVELLADNLNLVTAAALGFGATKLAQSIGEVGKKAVENSASTLAYVSSLNQQRAASIAVAEAEAATSAARVSGLTTLQAKLAAERQAAITQAAAATSTAARTQALMAASVAELNLTRTSAQLTAATAAQTAAQTALTAAITATSTAATVASKALNLVGGPIGLITTALGLGVTAWAAWGSSAESASAQAKNSIVSGHQEILSKLDEQIEKLQRRAALVAAGNAGVARDQGADVDELARLNSRIKGMESQGSPLSGPDQIAMIELQRQYDNLNAKIQKRIGLQETVNGLSVQERLNALELKKGGFTKEWLAEMKTWDDALKAGLKTPKEYAAAITEMNKRRYESTDAGKEAAKSAKAGASGVNDALTAMVQGYKNADKAILDGRKDFYDQMATFTKLGTKSESDAIEASIAKEEEVWAKRQANFEAELAQAAKKKNSQAEVARITGTMQDAERDYLQAITKLRAEAAIADAKAADALSERISNLLAANAATQLQIEAAQQEAKAVGLTGDALRAFNQERLESSIPLALRMQAAWAGEIGELGKLGDAARDQIQAFRDLAKAQGEARAKQLVYDYTKGIADGNRLLQAEISLMGQTERARETALEQLRIQLDLEKQIAAVKASMADSPERAQMIADLEASAAIAKANAASRVFLDDWKESVKQYDEVFRRGFADMVNGGKSAWKSFTTSLVTTFKTTVADQIYKMFLQPFVVRIVGSLMGITGMGAQTAAAAVGGGPGALDVLSGGKSAMGLFGGGAGAGFMNGLSAWGSGGSVTGVLSNPGLYTGAELLGTVAPILLGGIALFKILSGDWFGSRGPNHSGGVASTATTDRDLAARQALGTDAWGNTLGDFTSRKNEAIDKQLDATVKGMLDMYKALAKIGGVTAREVDIAAGFSTNPKHGDEGAMGFFQIIDKLTGEVLTKYKDRELDADPQKAWAQFVGDMGGALVAEIKKGDIPGWMREELDALGEDVTVEGLTAAIQKIAVIDASFKSWANTLVGFNDLNAKAQTALLKTSGGIEALTNNVNAFYAGFYSEAERAEILQRQVREQLKGLGVDIDPKGGEEAKKKFRKLIEDALASGNTELAAKLLALAQLFGVAADAAQKAAETAADAAKTAADEAARALEEAKQKAKDAALANFEAAVAREQEYWQRIVTDSQAAVQAISSILTPLKQNAKELFGSIDAAQQMQAAAGMVYIEQALAGVRGGAKLSTYDGLTDAISAARGGITSGRYASQFERDRDALVLANQLSQIAGYGDLQLSVEERQLKNSQEQLQKLDKTLMYWRDLLDDNKAQIDATLSVEAAIKALEKLMFPDNAGGGAQPGKDGGGAQLGGGGTGGWDGYKPSKYKRPQTDGSGGVFYNPVIDEKEIAKLDGLSGLYHSFDGTGDLRGLLDAIKSAGGSLSDLSALSGLYESDWRKAAESVGIPAFAIGTNLVPRDTLAVLHQGEAVVPKAFNPWAGGAGGMASGNNNARLEALVAQLIDENRTQAGQIVRLQSQVAKLLQRWDGDGMPQPRKEGEGVTA